MFLLKKKKNEARKRQWQMAMNRWDLATKKWEPKHHDVLCSKHIPKKCFTDLTLLSIQFGLKQLHAHRVTDLEKFSVRISKDETPTPLPVVGRFPLVIPVFSSLVRCVAFRSFSFCLLQLSQQARPHQRACLLLGVLFYFISPVYPCLFHHT